MKNGEKTKNRNANCFITGFELKCIYDFCNRDVGLLFQQLFNVADIFPAQS